MKNQSQFIAILGRQPEFGLVELESRLGAEAIRPFGRAAAMLAAEIDVATLGSVIKVGRVLYEGEVTDLRSLPIDAADLPMSDSKTPFALSVYGVRTSRREVEAAGLELKKSLRERGSVRFIAPKEGLEVTAAQLMHNKV